MGQDLNWLKGLNDVGIQIVQGFKWFKSLIGNKPFELIEVLQPFEAFEPYKLFMTMDLV